MSESKSTLSLASQLESSQDQLKKFIVKCDRLYELFFSKFATNLHGNVKSVEDEFFLILQSINKLSTSKDRIRQDFRETAVLTLKLLAYASGIFSAILRGFYLEQSQLLLERIESRVSHLEERNKLTEELRARNQAFLKSYSIFSSIKLDPKIEEYTIELFGNLNYINHNFPRLFNLLEMFDEPLISDSILSKPSLGSSNVFVSTSEDKSTPIKRDFPANLSAEHKTSTTALPANQQTPGSTPIAFFSHNSNSLSTRAISAITSKKGDDSVCGSVPSSIVIPADF